MSTIPTQYQNAASSTAFSSLLFLCFPISLYQNCRCFYLYQHYYVLNVASWSFNDFIKTILLFISLHNIPNEWIKFMNEMFLRLVEILFPFIIFNEYAWKIIVDVILFHKIINRRIQKNNIFIHSIGKYRVSVIITSHTKLVDVGATAWYFRAIKMPNLVPWISKWCIISGGMSATNSFETATDFKLKRR